MNILLVYPEHPVTFWSFKHALKFINKKANLPPLGVLTVAALLPDGWNKKIVDMNTDGLRDKDIQWADSVFISAMNIQRESVRKVIDRCKKMNRKTVGGGPLFTTEPENYGDVDHLLLYEGEVSIPRFLADLKNGSPKHLYDWDGYPELHETPLPSWELIHLRNYASLSIQYSRGCPFHCDFCNVVSLFGHSQRTKSAEKVVDELEIIYRLGWRGSVFFVDDNFIGNKEKLKSEVLPAIMGWMKEKNYPFRFNTEVSINIADDNELMELMVDAGFSTVFVGIETVDEESLAECNKIQNTRRDLVECVKTIHRHGIQVQGGFILGFDNDKPSIFSRVSSFIQQCGIVTAMVGMLNAPKGTKLYKRLEKENRLTKDFSGTNADINFSPKMDIDTLKDGYRDVVRLIYAPENYYKRIRLFLENFRPKKHSKKLVRINEIGAFFMACVRLGIISRGRSHYWKLLFWSLIKKRDVFPMAVELSIYGYHFRKCLPA
jgi:radical SAM superfamily enzyme YgiQ (UPF0313 family)